VTGAGGQNEGRPRLAVLTRDELARAAELLTRLDELAAKQRLAIARMASGALIALAAEQGAVEAELRALIEQACARGAEAREGAASASELDAVAALAARVRRTCQHNMVLLAHARRSVSLLLGIDEDRAGYDRRARRLSAPLSARVRAL
jgi:hypothetical protein